METNVPGLGKLGLNDSVIEKLQNYYGMSVCSNVGNLNAMKKAIYASWSHVSSSKENNFHIHCPEGANSWCTYQADIANGTSTHIHGKGVKPEIIKHVKAVFGDLWDVTLLKRCLHGQHTKCK